MNPWELIFEGQRVRVVTREDETWFIAVDVCDILTIGNMTNAVRDLDVDWKQKARVRTDGRIRNVELISESGLYELILASKKPRAKAFKRWIFTDVIPQIRRTGRYTPEGSQPAIEQATPSGATDATGPARDPSKTYVEVHPLNPGWGPVHPSWFMDSAFPVTLTVPGTGRYVVDAWPGHPPRVRIIPEGTFWESVDVQIQRAQFSIVLGTLQTICGLWLNYRIASDSESEATAQSINELERVIIQAGELAARLTGSISGLASKRAAPKR